jgi:hypothetical protein
MKQVESLKRMEPPPRLPAEEIREELPLDVFGDQHRNRSPSQEDGFLGVIVDDDGAVAELVKLPGVEFRGLVAQVAMREEELRRALDAGALLADPIHLAFPASSEAGNDFVFAGERAPGDEMERLDGQRSILPVLLEGPPALEPPPNFVPVRDGCEGGRKDQRRNGAHPVDDDRDQHQQGSQ